MKIRVMTPDGVDAFRTWLNGGASGDIPAELLSGNRETNPFQHFLGIEQRKFTCRYELWKYRDWETDRKSTRLNSSHSAKSRMPSSA